MNIATNLYKKHFFVLAISKSDNHDLFINASHFIQTKNQIVLNNSNVYYSFEQAMGELKKEIPLIITFHGKDVIARYSNSGEKNLFDEIQMEDFYKQDVQFSLGWKLQTLIRKEIVDNIIKTFVQKGFFILGLSLGISSIQSIEELIRTTEFNLNGISFKLNNEQITEISPGTKGECNLCIKDEIYDEIGTIMISSLLSNLKGETLSLPQIQSSTKEYRYFSLNKKILPVFISVLFIILLVNFLVYTQLSENMKKIQVETKSSREKSDQIKILEARINEYFNIYGNHKEKTEASFSYLSDRVATKKPDELWFSTMILYPISSRIEDKKPININKSIIALKGNLKTPEVLNSFIENLKKEEWIKDIQLQDYKWRNDKTYAEFDIYILMKQ